MSERDRAGAGAVRSLGWGRFPKEIIESGVWGVLTGSACAVLGVLLAHANARGECWPSRSTIARGAGVNVGTVRRAIRELCGHGAIVVLRIGGCGRSTRYLIPSIALAHEGGAGAPVDRREGARPRAGEGAPARGKGRARAPQTHHKRDRTASSSSAPAPESRRTPPRWLTPELQGRLAMVARCAAVRNRLVVRRLRERYATLAEAIEGGLASVEELATMDPREFAALIGERALALPRADGDGGREAQEAGSAADASPENHAEQRVGGLGAVTALVGRLGEALSADRSVGNEVQGVAMLDRAEGAGYAGDAGHVPA